MRKNRFNFMLTLMLLALGSVFFACSTDNSDDLNDAKFSNNNLSSKVVTQTACDITGNSVITTGNAVVSASSSSTFIYTNSTGTVGSIVWTLTGNAIFSGTTSQTITTTGNTVTVDFSSNFTGGTLTAFGSGGDALTCETELNISKVVGDSGNCSCPNPVIRCTLAVSGGHPYWRLELDNLETGDTYVWSQLHAPFMSGTNSTYVIVNPDGPMYSGFTVYCEVSRTCPNGTVNKRKAYYTNYYGGTTTTGTTGFIGSCSGGVGNELD